MPIRRSSSWPSRVATWSLGVSLLAPAAHGLAPPSAPAPTAFAAPTSDVPAVECTLSDGRRYRIAAASGPSPRSTLSYTPKVGGRQIDLSIGVPTFRRAAACDAAQPCPAGTFSFRSPNGGIILELDAAGVGSTLDIFVSFELEVNVDVSLSPDIDELNTHGRQPATCRLLDSH